MASNFDPGFCRLVILALYIVAASVLTRSFIPRFLKLSSQHIDGQICCHFQTNELYQLVLVAFGLLSAWCSDKLGISLELGSFVAGVMISITDFAQHTLDQIGLALVGLLGILYNGVSLANLAIALFALVAIESGS